MNEIESTVYTCPLCCNKFVGADCRGSCVMSAGCNMVRCPRCAYEFVEEGTLANLIRKMLGLELPGNGPGGS